MTSRPYGVGLILVTAGLALQSAGVVWTELGSVPRFVSGVIAGALLVAGCAGIARSKGYWAWLGFAGLFSYLGAGALILLVPRSSIRILRPRSEPDGTSGTA